MGSHRMKVKEAMNLENVFGDLSRKLIWTDEPSLETGDIITIVNTNCEFEFDSYHGVFNQNLMYAYIVDADIIDVDTDNYLPEKSNNGGCYAFARCRIKKIIEKGY